jgi:hypothetical protein
MWTMIVVFLATQTTLTIPGYTSVQNCSAARMALVNSLTIATNNKPLYSDCLHVESR